MHFIRTLNRGLLAAALAVATLPLAISTASAHAGCIPQILDLGTLGGPGSGVYGSNQVGDWVGGADDASGHTHAVIWHGTKIRDLGVTDSWAADITDAGVVVGTADSGAFSWRAGVARPLPVPAGWHDSYVRRVNKHDEAAGALTDPYGHGHAVVWRGLRTIAILPTPAGFDDADAEGINDAGAVVGDVFNETTGQNLAWEWSATGAGFPVAPTDPAGFSAANVINDRGWVGESLDFGGLFGLWAGVYRDGSPHKLGQFGADVNFSVVYGQDQVGDYTGSGTYNPEDTDLHVYITHVGLGKLLTLRPLSRDLLDTSNAHAVMASSLGVSVGGDSTTASGDDHATVWTCAYRQAIDPVAVGLSRPDPPSASATSVTPKHRTHPDRTFEQFLGSDPVGFRPHS